MPNVHHTEQTRVRSHRRYNSLRRGRHRGHGRCLVLVGLAGLILPSAARAQLLPVMRTDARISAVEELRIRRLLFPVAGRSGRDIRDSFSAPRDSGRVHHATDIRAPRGTAVLSADYGRIIKLDRSATGGLSIYATDAAERYIYYYAHLDRYRTGLREGQPLARGDTIGFVGTSGNAPPNAPHLHFAIRRAISPRYWWRGTPVNPYRVFRTGDMQAMRRLER